MADLSEITATVATAVEKIRGIEVLFDTHRENQKERHQDLKERMLRLELAAVAFLVTIVGFVVRAVLTGVTL